MAATATPYMTPAAPAGAMAHISQSDRWSLCFKRISRVRLASLVDHCFFGPVNRYDLRSVLGFDRASVSVYQSFRINKDRDKNNV